MTLLGRRDPMQRNRITPISTCVIKMRMNVVNRDQAGPAVMKVNMGIERFHQERIRRSLKVAEWLLRLVVLVENQFEELQHQQILTANHLILLQVAYQLANRIMKKQAQSRMIRIQMINLCRSSLIKIRIWKMEAAWNLRTHDTRTSCQWITGLLQDLLYIDSRPTFGNRQQTPKNVNLNSSRNHKVIDKWKVSWSRIKLLGLLKVLHQVWPLYPWLHSKIPSKCWEHIKRKREN